jgi:hypothetical protein
MATQVRECGLLVIPPRNNANEQIKEFDLARIPILLVKKILTTPNSNQLHNPFCPSSFVMLQAHHAACTVYTLPDSRILQLPLFLLAPYSTLRVFQGDPLF